MIVRLLGCFLAILGLVSCQAREYERKDYAEMNAIALKRLCVGRLEIDVPANGTLEWRASFDQADVTRMRPPIQSADAFWSRVENRKVELEALPHRTEGNRLGLYEKIGDDAAIILYRDREHRKGSYMMERYLWLGDRGYLFESGPWPNDVRDQVDRNSRVFSQMIPHDDKDRPQASGFCIDGATVTGDWKGIMATIRTAPRHWASGELSISVGEDHAAAASDDADAGEERFQIGAYHDLERDEEECRLLRSDSDFGTRPDTIRTFEVMRKREREALNRPGKEAVWKKIANSGAVIYEFRWYNEDASGSKEKPGLSFDMRVGDLRAPNEDVPSEEELFALWDAVLESLRSR